MAVSHWSSSRVYISWLMDLSLSCFEHLKYILQQNINIIENIISNKDKIFAFKSDIYHNLITIENYLVFYLYIVTKFHPTLRAEIEEALTTVYKYRIRYSKYCT